MFPSVPIRVLGAESQPEFAKPPKVLTVLPSPNSGGVVRMGPPVNTSVVIVEQAPPLSNAVRVAEPYRSAEKLVGLKNHLNDVFVAVVLSAEPSNAVKVEDVHG